eukprot:142052_1
MLSFTALLIVSPLISTCSWKHTISSLPFPISSQQVAYNEPNVYLFGDNPSVPGTLKWNMSNMNNKWKIMNDEPPSFSSNSQSTVSIQDTLYFIGVNTSQHSDIFLFNLTTEQWITNTSIPKMTYSAINSCISKNSTHIFVIGGLYNNKLLNNNSYLQTFDIQNNKWIKPQNIPFINKGLTWSNQMCSMVVNILYVFGGLYNNTNISNIVYKYNTQTSQWKFISNMSKPLHNAWSVYYTPNKTIYIIGGSSNDNDLSIGIQHQIQIFNVTSETFIGYNNMMDSIENAPSLIVSNNIFVFGGNTPNGKLSSIQISDLPLKVASSDSVNVIYWRIIAFTSGMIGFVVFCCCLELKISKKNKRINQDPLIIQNDMTNYNNIVNE